MSDEKVAAQYHFPKKPNQQLKITKEDKGAIVTSCSSRKQEVWVPESLQPVGIWTLISEVWVLVTPK